MLCLKTRTFLKSKIIGYVDNYCGYVTQEKQCLRILKKYNCNAYINIDKNYLHAVLCYKEKRSNIEHCINVQNNVNLSHLANFIRKLCTKISPKEYDVFGNISYEEYERDEMVEDEAEMGKFTKVLNSERLSYGEYVKLIKSYLKKKNVNLALSVLDLMKENGDKPNLFIYRLLISAFAVQGDIKQCFKLYKKIKDSGMTPSPQIYTSLIQACAESTDTDIALQRLFFLRRHFHEKNMNINVIQYSALVRAYGRHNQVLTAFEIADEARNNGIFSNSMIVYLYHATISDTKHGLKYALALWHKIKTNKFKINILHYNLLLRAIRDTNFGDLKVNDVLSLGSPETVIQLKDIERSDLLDSPPVLSTSVLTMIKKFNSIHQSNANSTELDVISNVELISQNLDNVLKSNRLLLFGGINKFLNRMKSDGVEPDEKTLTLLLHLLPSTMEAENYFLKYIRKNNMKINITFFNILIKKRCKRKCYSDAKNVLNEMQSYHLTPNIVTFGVLAIGCTRYKDGVELLEQMNTIGYVPNYTILETLLLNACYYKTFSYVVYLMYYLLKNQIKPSIAILNMLEKFDEVVFQLVESKPKYDGGRISITKADYNRFKIKYENWQEEVRNTFHG